ncbi:MAG: helix-turn-helix domain-containing protein [Syntrophobacteraceae bacterium]
MKVSDNTKKKEAQRISNPIVPQLLSLKDAALFLGLSPWALRERVWQGHIPFVRFPGGKKQYFHVKDLEGFIEENKARYV